MKKNISAFATVTIFLASIPPTAVSAVYDSIPGKTVVSSSDAVEPLLSDASKVAINPSAFVIIGLVLILAIVAYYIYRRKKGLVEKRPEDDFFEMLKKDKESEQETSSVEDDNRED